MGKTFPFKENRAVLLNGIKDGVPIGLGYFAVSFSLGIAAKAVGLTPGQGFLVSALCMASAGEYIGFTMIVGGATLLETAVATLIINARYLLMSCSLSQKMDPSMHMGHRLITGYYITDEIYGASISRPGIFNPWYTYGLVIPAVPGWSFGTMLGVIAGNMLPLRVVSAFSVMLYGMFIAIVIPAAHKDKVVLGVVAASFVLSGLAQFVPFFTSMSEGTKIIILTLVIASAAAVLFPRDDAEEEM